MPDEGQDPRQNGDRRPYEAAREPPGARVHAHVPPLSLVAQQLVARHAQRQRVAVVGALATDVVAHDPALSALMGRES